jgi:hypothetical protein
VRKKEWLKQSWKDYRTASSALVFRLNQVVDRVAEPVVQQLVKCRRSAAARLSSFRIATQMPRQFKWKIVVLAKRVVLLNVRLFTDWAVVARPAVQYLQALLGVNVVGVPVKDDALRPWLLALRPSPQPNGNPKSTVHKQRESRGFSSK